MLFNPRLVSSLLHAKNSHGENGPSPGQGEGKKLPSYKQKQTQTEMTHINSSCGQDASKHTKAPSGRPNIPAASMCPHSVKM